MLVAALEMGVQSLVARPYILIDAGLLPRLMLRHGSVMYGSIMIHPKVFGRLSE